MGDDSNVPLTSEERDELERLRADKARKDRAELERLRREQLSAAAEKPAGAVGEPTCGDASAAPAGGPRTFGQRMVLSGGPDEDGIPSMPPAQKIIIILCLLCVAVALTWIVMTNTGMI